MLAALDKWHEIAKAEGVPAAELAFRWVFYHSILDASKGDAVIIGASSLAQLKGTVAGIRKGPLSAEAQKGIQGVWEGVKQDAFLDNVNGLSDDFKKNLGEAVKQHTNPEKASWMANKSP